MGENCFLQILQISVSMVPVILLLKLWGNLIQKRYVARWKYYIWLVLALRLLIPWTPALDMQPMKIIIPDSELVALETPDESMAVVYEEKAPVESLQIPVGQSVVTASSQLSVVEAPALVPQKKSREAVALSVHDVVRLAEFVWFFGMCLYLCHNVMINVLTGKRLRRWSRLADETLYGKIKKALGESTLPKGLKIVVNPQLAGPMVMGLFRPVLYLPEIDYREEELELILRHELTHYKRGDLWYKAVLLLANGVHWFNPFVYLMYREAEKDLECSCDSSVMENVGKGARVSYAHLILDTAGGQRMSRRLLTGNFYGGAKDMKRRLQNILDTKRKKHGIMTFLVLVVISVGAGSLVGFQLLPKEERTTYQEAVEKKKEFAEQKLAEMRESASESQTEENSLLVDKNFESPIAFLNEHMEQWVDEETLTTNVSLGEYASVVSAYTKEGGSTFYELEYGNDVYNDIHYEIKDNSLICEVGLYQGQTFYRGKAILHYVYENGEYVVDEERVSLTLDADADIIARSTLQRYGRVMADVDGLRLTYNGEFEDRLTLHRVREADGYNVLTVYLGNGLIADYKFPSNSPIENDICHIYHLPMQSHFYDTLILMLQDPYLKSTDESTDFYILHVEMNEEETKAEIVIDAAILDDGTNSENYEEYKDKYLEMPFYHVINDMEAGPHYHEDLGVTTLRIVGMPYERMVEQYAYVYWDGEGFKTYFE